MVMCHNRSVAPGLRTWSLADWGLFPGFPGRCAGHGKGGEAVAEDQVSGRRLRRRRRANIDGPTRFVRVSMSEQERARLLMLEERTGRSPSEVLVSAALYARSSESLTERRALASELIAARRYLAALSNNVNQLAKHANAKDEFPEEARVALGRVRTIAERINGVVGGLAG